jgi:hypothetical protein
MGLLIVYCERGAFTAAVKEQYSAGAIHLIHGPYEGKLKRAKPAHPSLVTLDSELFTIDSDVPISDLEYSEKFAEIVRVVGKNNHQDALHLDSAYKSKADAFVTADLDDIASHRDELEPLVNLRIFHVPSEDHCFAQWVRSQADV